MVARSPQLRIAPRPLPAGWLLTAALVPLIVLAGLIAYRHAGDVFLLGRGPGPPLAQAGAMPAGKQTTIHVRSAALGGRSPQVVVYLPPGYAQNPGRRYPVMYLLHGFPGRPGGLFKGARLGTRVSSLMTQGRIGGMILVAPSGTTSLYVDREWANGVGSDNGWETFVARDLVRAIDRRYRTIRSGAGRAIAGLSEGGYGALNIALHHPGEFRVVESWSGYMLADDLPSVFGNSAARRAYNSPADYLPKVAARLRGERVFVWFYCGTSDPLLGQNRAFDAELARYRIPHFFFTVRGRHSWQIWRGNAGRALVAAARRLAQG